MTTTEEAGRGWMNVNCATRKEKSFFLLFSLKLVTRRVAVAVCGASNHVTDTKKKPQAADRGSVLMFRGEAMHRAGPTNKALRQGLLRRAGTAHGLVFCALGAVR